MSDDFLVLEEQAKPKVDKNGVSDEQNAATQNRLKGFIERIQNVEEQEAAVRGDKKEIYAEAKGEGFDTKAIRKIISLLKKDKLKREAEEAVLDLYKTQIGMLD